MRARAIIVVLVVLALRLPFLNQAVQGDDYYFLAGAMHAQIEPLHPTHGSYVFEGREVDMRGHPHPPLNMWFLGALLATFGDIYEIPFHSAYILFSLIAAMAMLALAERFTKNPLWATLLFLAVPTFVVNGSSFESDLPFLAMWMAATALFVRAVDKASVPTMAAAAVTFGLAALAAYQAVVLAPILGLYLWMHRRSWLPGWAVLAVPFAVLGGWQLFELVTGGSLPAGVLAGYFEGYGLQALGSKMASALALTVHTGWLVFPALAWLAFGRVRVWWWTAIGIATVIGGVVVDPHPLFWISFATGLLVVVSCISGLLRRPDADQLFLFAWLLVFFAAAVALFFAGSARYLLPIAAPVAMLVADRLRERPAWLAAGLVCQLVVSLGLAVMNYQHWDGYRRFVAGLSDEIATHRTWINGEWGLRFYGEAVGGLPLEESQAVRPGEMVLTSPIAYPSTFTTGGGGLTPLAETPITSVSPLRIIGLGVKSAYSTVTLGFRPFDIGFGPIDTPRAEIVVERAPTLDWIEMGSPEAENQIVSGIYQLEGGEWRWMSRRAVVLLAAPVEPRRVAVDLYIPDQSPARQVRLTLDGTVVAEQRYDTPGSYTLESDGPVEMEGSSASLEIWVDASFSPPGDPRELGIILAGAGFR